MFWIVQKDLYDEYNYQEFLDALVKMDVPHALVQPIPFTNTLVDEPIVNLPPDAPVVVSGSVSLVRVARNRNWTPGSFSDETFTYQDWRDGFGAAHCLNGNAAVSSLVDAKFRGIDMFVRPTLDNKSFTGMVMSREEFIGWQSYYAEVEPEDEFQTLHKDTEIMMCTPRNIMAEYRFFVVDGKVVTGSLYSRNRRVIYEECTEPDVIEYAQSMVDIHQPAKAFVIDIARVDGEFKIIEINNLNSAGFYASDVQKIIAAIEELTPYYQENIDK